MKPDSENACVNKKKACLKLLAIAAVTVVLIFLFGSFIDEETISGIKDNFSLWTIIALVIVINLVSFLCFIAMFAAYKWVQADLKPQDERDLD